MTKVRKLTRKRGNKERDIQDLIQDFLEFCEMKGNGRDALNSHKYALNHFFNEYNGALEDEVAIKKRLVGKSQKKICMVSTMRSSYMNNHLMGITEYVQT